MFNILLLGGTGFIGKNIIESFQNEVDYNLIIVSRNTELIDKSFFLGKNAEIILGSIKDSNFIEKIILDYKVNVVFHLVSSLIPASSQTDFYNSLDDVIVPTFKLIDFIATRDIKLIFFSSGGTIYGNSIGLIEEDTNLSPINNYGYSKLIIENYIRYKSNISLLDYIILRPSNVYGKYQSFDGNQGFISVAINKIQNDQIITIWGTGKVIRDYIHVDDLTAVLKKILSNSICNNSFNLSTGIGFSLLDIIKIIENNLNKKAVLSFDCERIVDANSVILDNSKILKIIDHDFINIEEGIKSQINHFNTTFYNAI
ncbi:NAD-dependent epimerase/dehydratase family protein [Flavobacterium sp. DGU38]|uniref:NAD-dependent epimerase/dehydratase family protein n=1 Tax=Flavobacterium calami TaxID=3139144 RepID=A0ABU9IJK9_9FLAO